MGIDALKTEQKSSFPFEELCGCCENYKTSYCKFNGITDTLTRWKTLNCQTYEKKK